MFFDFNKIENIPEDLHHKFDMVVIDPPFITREVWEKYAEISRLLLKEEGGHALLSTIDENEEMILEIMGAKRRAFRPSIPNLVYQYSFYTTYEHPDLDEKNAEIPEFDWINLIVNLLNKGKVKKEINVKLSVSGPEINQSNTHIITASAHSAGHVRA